MPSQSATPEPTDTPVKSIFIETNSHGEYPQLLGMWSLYLDGD
ncbi:hypothetical protein [Geitlerinema sp. PCC 9228]|nr:hypothetical protein [Geitlerinema sp. PCC 9228]